MLDALVFQNSENCKPSSVFTYDTVQQLFLTFLRTVIIDYIIYMYILTE